MTPSEEALQQAILEYIQRSDRLQTSTNVISSIRRETGQPRKRVRSAIRTLLDTQHLIYSYKMGCSFLLENPIRLWQPTPNIWILPPNCSSPTAHSPDAIVVRLGVGAAFGSGEHPTTILCLQALDYLYSQDRVGNCFNGKAIDIGTGSGILALVAAKMGSQSILALDTDPCAREETRANIALNQLSQSIEVDSKPFETLVESYALILANLRFPTLLKLLPWAKEHLLPGGRLVISGCLEGELPRLKTHFEALNLKCCWSASRKRWAAGVFGLSGP